MISEDLINQAILLARERPADFNFHMLQRKLHVGTVKANQLIDELAAKNIVKVEITPSYHITVIGEKGPSFLSEEGRLLMRSFY